MSKVSAQKPSAISTVMVLNSRSPGHYDLVAFHGYEYRKGDNDMKTTTTKVLTIALAGLALTTSAHADKLNGLYISGALGNTWTNDADFNDSGTTGDIELDNGVNVAAAIGFAPREYRTELELSYRKADLDSLYQALLD